MFSFNKWEFSIIFNIASMNHWILRNAIKNVFLWYAMIWNDPQSYYFTDVYVWIYFTEFGVICHCYLAKSDSYHLHNNPDDNNEKKKIPKRIRYVINVLPREANVRRWRHLFRNFGKNKYVWNIIWNLNTLPRNLVVMLHVSCMISKKKKNVRRIYTNEDWNNKIILTFKIVANLLFLSEAGSRQYRFGAIENYVFCKYM